MWRFPRDDFGPMLAQVRAVSGTKDVAILRSDAEVRAYLQRVQSKGAVGALADVVRTT
jgi:hypothetical protein